MARLNDILEPDVATKNLASRQRTQFPLSLSLLTNEK